MREPGRDVIIQMTSSPAELVVAVESLARPRDAERKEIRSEVTSICARLSEEIAELGPWSEYAPPEEGAAVALLGFAIMVAIWVLPALFAVFVLTRIAGRAAKATETRSSGS